MGRMLFFQLLSERFGCIHWDITKIFVGAYDLWPVWIEGEGGGVEGSRVMYAKNKLILY